MLWVRGDETQGRRQGECIGYMTLHLPRSIYAGACIYTKREQEQGATDKVSGTRDVVYAGR